MDANAFLVLVALPELPADLTGSVEETLLPVLGEAFERDPLIKEGFAGAVGEERLRVVGVPDPIPEEVLAGPLRGAWYWPEAEEEMARHRAHLVVVVKGPKIGKPVMRALFLTRVTAMLLRGLDGVGVFWAGSPSVHSADAFLASSDEMTPEQLPLRLWVDFQVWRNDDDGTHSLRTNGMDSFGRFELEVHGSTKDQDEVASWAYNVAHYILASDVDVEDGHAVGRSPTEWIRVHHTSSVFDDSKKVYYLDLEAEK